MDVAHTARHEEEATPAGVLGFGGEDRVVEASDLGLGVINLVQEALVLDALDSLVVGVVLVFGAPPALRVLAEAVLLDASGPDHAGDGAGEMALRLVKLEVQGGGGFVVLAGVNLCLGHIP